MTKRYCDRCATELLSTDKRWLFVSEPELTARFDAQRDCRGRSVDLCRCCVEDIGRAIDGKAADPVPSGIFLDNPLKDALR